MYIHKKIVHIKQNNRNFLNLQPCYKFNYYLWLMWREHAGMKVDLAIQEQSQWTFFLVEIKPKYIREYKGPRAAVMVCQMDWVTALSYSIRD